MQRAHRLFLLVAGASSVGDCSKEKLDLDGWACEAGQCAPDYVCNTVRNLCVPPLAVGCGVAGALCPSQVVTGDTCQKPGTFVPCVDDASDCSSGCRTCEANLTWGECSDPACRDADGDGMADCRDACIDRDDDGLGDLASGNSGCANAAKDTDISDRYRCGDTDLDGCEDCTSGHFDTANDGLDTEGDGLCNLGDPDDDNDTVADAQDNDPLNRFRCYDLETGIGDGCDECGITGGPPDAAKDGPDANGDGKCDKRSRRMKLTFNNSAGVALTDFPVLVVLNSSRVDYGLTQNAGQDIVFTDADGTSNLAHAIEQWNESGTSYVWVKAPQIDASDADFIYLYYGNSTATDLQNPAGVFSAGFAGVWHLADDPSGAPPQEKDATTSANHGVTQGAMPSAARIDNAACGRALHFAGTDDAVKVDNDPTDLQPTNGTLSFWLRTPSVANRQGLLTKDATGVADGSLTISVEIDGYLRVSLESATPLVSSSALMADTWYHVGISFGAAGLALYVNGAPAGTDPTTLGLSSNANPIFLGTSCEGCTDANGTGANFFFTGDLDEVRLSSVARSAAWLDAENRACRDTMITYGAPEAR